MEEKSINIFKIINDRGFKDTNYLNKVITSKLNKKTDLFYKRDLVAHYGCVNAIEFSNNGQYLVSGGDDKRVLLWNIQKALHNSGSPAVMLSKHNSNIFCLSFDNSVTHIYSAGNDDLIILHDIQTRKICDVYNLDHPVYGISVDPLSDNIFASAGEDGRILIFDTRLKSSDPYQLASSKSAFHSVMFNPVDPRLITTANSKEGAALWDIRVPNEILLQYGSKKSCMNVKWDRTGTKILALRRRQVPILYEYNNPKAVAQFCHENYYNSCTMKSCSFAGLKDEFVLSGSDDFNLYVWKISDAMKSESKTNNVHMVLKGHRSIVNQIRFEPYNCIIASSGVEKIIKVWSPMPLPYSNNDFVSWTRKRYTYNEYITLLLRSGQFMSHDYSEQSTSEDPQMIAFFDSLVQREREGLETDSDNSSGSSQCIESFDDTDYSSLSEEFQNSPSHIQQIVHVGEQCKRLNKNNETWRKNHSKLIKRRKYQDYDDDHTASSSASSSVSSVKSSCRLSPSSSASSSSSEEDTDNNRIVRKMKLFKSNVKDALERLKHERTTSSVEPPLSATEPEIMNETNENNSSEICSSSGTTSTDTVDSGFCAHSSNTFPKYKFSSFKRNQKRKYRSRHNSFSLSESCSSDTE